MNQNILFQEYELEGVIGQGSFATVYKARNIFTNQTVAIKAIDLKKASSSFSKEVEILEQLEQTENIINLIEYFETTEKLYLVLEYCRTDMFDAIVTDGMPLDHPILFDWFLQVCTAIERMHQMNLYHRDIKLENILINENNQATLTDFGLATSSKYSIHKVGTEAYMAPECFNMSNRSKLSQTFSSEKNDVWALGVMLILILAREHPWETPSYFDPQFRFHFFSFQDVDTFRQEFGFSNELCLILRQVFNLDPFQRPTVTEFKQMIVNMQYVYHVDTCYQPSLIPSDYRQAIQA
ncbi:hypothetical protein HDV04_000600 [Boothiomyces sp. JEL0838]|nr:hypothetical protein HDV04_000600 [Boothiomyces sp. JEL0838]